MEGGGGERGPAQKKLGNLGGKHENTLGGLIIKADLFRKRKCAIINGVKLFGREPRVRTAFQHMCSLIQQQSLGATGEPRGVEEGRD